VEEVEEDPEEVIFYVETEDGRIMAVNSEGNLRTPSPSLALASPIPAADAPPSPLVAPAPDAPAPASTGGDSDNSGDDDEDEEEDDNNNNNDNDDDDNADGNQGNGPRKAGEINCTHTSEDECGYFPTLLQDMLWDLGNTVKPLYITSHILRPAHDDCYFTRVHIRECLETSRGLRTHLAHDSNTPHTTYATSISNAARRALWSLCYTHRQELGTTNYHHLPCCISGTEETVVLMGEDGEDHINILARVTTALNTDLEGATVELD
jgi:hypothetical protein